MASYSYSLKAWTRIFQEVMGTAPSEDVLRHVENKTYAMPDALQSFLENWVRDCVRHPRPLVCMIPELEVIVFGSGDGIDSHCWFSTYPEFVEFCRKLAEGPDALDGHKKLYEKARAMTDQATTEHLEALEKMGSNAPKSFDVNIEDGSFATVFMRSDSSLSSAEIMAAGMSKDPGLLDAISADGKGKALAVVAMQFGSEKAKRAMNRHRQSKPFINALNSWLEKLPDPALMLVGKGLWLEWMEAPTGNFVAVTAIDDEEQDLQKSMARKLDPAALADVLQRQDAIRRAKKEPNVIREVRIAPLTPPQSNPANAN